MSDTITMPESLPHVLCVTVRGFPQQSQFEFPTRDAAIHAARKADERGQIEHETSNGLWVLVKTGSDSQYIVIPKHELQRAAIDHARPTRIVAPG